MLTGRDIICFANDWKGDPLSKKHLMLRLARRNRILWVNSLHNRQPRLAGKDVRRIAQKIREFFAGLENVHPNIWQITPLYLPFLGRKWIRTLNQVLLRWQLRLAMRRLAFQKPITWSFVPSSADIVGGLGESLILYHCVDEFAAFSDAAGEVTFLEEKLLNKADLVLAASVPLLERKQMINKHTYLALHGVDYEHFKKAVEDDTPIPQELRDLPRPILGFHGLLADWVDLELIAEIARRRPDWSIVLVGRIDTDVTCLQGLTNLRLLGHRSYSRLPEYLRGFDVALLPFVCNELTRNANPLKLREYLAAGLPVVAAPLPEIARFKDLVSLALNADDYVRVISSLIEQGTTGPSRERSEKIASESWDHKAAEIEELVVNWLRIATN